MPQGQYSLADAKPIGQFSLADVSSDGGPLVPTPSVADMLSGRVGRDVNVSDAQTTPSRMDNVIESLRPLAHPQTLGDFMALLVPSEFGMGGAGSLLMEEGRRAKQAIRAANAETRGGVASHLSLPLRAIGKFYDQLGSTSDRVVNDTLGKLRGASAAAEARLPPAQSPDIVDRALAYAKADELGTAARDADQMLAYSRGASPAPSAINIRSASEPDVVDKMLGYAKESKTESAAGRAAGSAPSALDSTTVTNLRRQGYPPDLIAKIEARAAQDAGGMQPIASHAAVPSESPLRQPRMDIGAQAVGRQSGMTTAEVRKAAGPVLDEAAGEASPILPQKALSRIVDDMRKLSPGAEREAYVARATSGKAKWQIENIRRTLEHLGLLVPLTAGPAARLTLLRMMASHGSSEQP